MRLVPIAVLCGLLATPHAFGQRAAKPAPRKIAPARTAPKKQPPRAAPARTSPKKQPGDNPRKRLAALRRWFGPPPTPAQKAARKQRFADEVKRIAASRQRPLAATPSNVDVWTNLGPMGQFTTDDPGQDVDTGRLSGVAVIGNNVFVASPGGGLMRALSANVNATTPWAWDSVTDYVLTTTSSRGGLAVGAMATGYPGSGRIYLGTGDYRDNSAGGEIYFGDQLMGNTLVPVWTKLGVGLDANFVLSMGVISTQGTSGGRTTHTDTLFVGTEQGLFMGTSNQSSLSRVSTISDGEVWSVQTDGASTVVVSQLKDGAASIYYSDDRGTSWTKATLKSSVTAVNPQRITLAMSPANSANLWGIAAAPNGDALPGLLKSTDHGKTWDYQALTAWNDGTLYADANQLLTVSPDGNTLFFGTGGGLFRAKSDGTDVTQIGDDDQDAAPYLHADLHAAAWWNIGTTSNPSWVLLVASDGGLSVFKQPFGTVPTRKSNGKVVDDLSFLDNSRNLNLPIMQAYNLASTMATDATDLIGLGSQDNGTRLRRKVNGTLSGSSVFYEVASCGDGFGVLLHPTNGNKMIAACDSETISWSTNAKSAPPTFDDSSGITEAGGNDAFYWTKLVPAPAAGDDTVYTFVNKKVYKSTDYGATWSAPKMKGFDTSFEIRNLATSASSASLLAIVAGKDDKGKAYVTTDGGDNWTAMGSLPGSGGMLSAVWFDSKDSTSNTIYIASVAMDPSKNHLWKSTNRGSSFTAIDRMSNNDSNGFPFGFAVHVVKNNPSVTNDLFAGTDVGVYRSTDGGASWSRYGQPPGLPMAAVTDMYLAPDGSAIRISTFGRGLWEAALK